MASKRIDRPEQVDIEDAPTDTGLLKPMAAWLWMQTLPLELGLIPRTFLNILTTAPSSTIKIFLTPFCGVGLWKRRPSVYFLATLRVSNVLATCE